MAFPSLIDYKRYIEENKPNGKPVPNRSDSPSEKPVLYHDTAGYVKKHVQNASAMMSQIQDNMPLSKISASILNSVSIELLKSERSILASFQGREKPVPYKKDAGMGANPDDFCSVSAPKHALLAVRYKSFLPPFHYEWYSRKAKEKDDAGQYYLDAEFDIITEAAVTEYISKNGPINVPSGLVYLVFRRGIRPGGKMPIDNNNVYTGAITNAISRVLQHGDGWQQMSFVYTAIEDTDGPYLDVILCKKSDITRWIEA